MLLEACTVSTTGGTTICPGTVQPISLHSGYGPWNGRIIAVATGSGHTEPLWWPPGPGMQSLQASIAVNGRAVPSIPWTATHDLSSANTCALIYGMEAFHGKATKRTPVPNQVTALNRPCRWDGHAGGDGRWPQAAGSIPCISKLKDLLSHHRLANGHIIGDAHRWARDPANQGDETSSPLIIALAGENGAFCQPADGFAQGPGGSPGSLIPADARIIARGGGGCHAILICHEAGHIWATAGNDTERRLGRLIKDAGFERITPRGISSTSPPSIQEGSATHTTAAEVGRLPQ